jgi:site-specific DNA-methyltransferase (adenine-specific)
MSTANAYKKKQTDYDPDSWETPDKLFIELDLEFNFTLDVCADAHNSKCQKYFDKETDGLKQDWSKDKCFMNPPYSQVDIWLTKAYEESQRGAFVVALIKADTSTAWWHKWYPLIEKQEIKVRFLKRIQFIPPPGYIGKVGSPNMGHCLFIFGDLGNK